MKGIIINKKILLLLSLVATSGLSASGDTITDLFSLKKLLGAAAVVGLTAYAVDKSGILLTEEQKRTRQYQDFHSSKAKLEKALETYATPKQKQNIKKNYTVVLRPADGPLSNRNWWVCDYKGYIGGGYSQEYDVYWDQDKSTWSVERNDTRF